MSWKALTKWSEDAFAALYGLWGLYGVDSRKKLSPYARWWVPDDAVVLIHDGVRPFVSTGLIRDLVAASADAPAGIPVVPVVDTLRWADCHFPDPDRSKIVAVQTPQVFSAAAIKEAYGRAFDLSYTDDASVAAANGIPLTHVRGERYNIKITTPEDLEMARAIISSCSL